MGKTTKLKTEFVEKHWDHGKLRFKNLKKTRGMKRRSGGYSYRWEGDVFDPETNKKFGSFSRMTGNSLKDLKTDIKTGFVYINRRR